MDPDVRDEVLSSGVRLKIADALSVRPRTLRELAAVTGISVQGVLRHLRRLGEIGLVEERKLPARTLKARALYVAKKQLVGDYSTRDLTIIKPTEKRSPEATREGGFDFEEMAAEALVLQRRVKEQARRLGRMIDELVEEREAMKAGLDGLSLGPEERLILEVLLTEETLDDGLRALSKFYGIEDRRSIDKVLAKARRIGRK